MKKKVLLVTTLLVVAMMSTPLFSTVQAKITEINDMVGYTEYYGTMGGANFYVLIPDVWENPLGDGMLVLLCRSGAFQEDPRQSFEDYPFAQYLVGQGIAVAASNFGSMQSGTKEGVIRTHQLTEYVIENFGVTGKVFLCGTSLGGSVALILAEKYPEVYSGVLDVSGVKDWAFQFNNALSYSGSDPFLIFWFNLGIAMHLQNYGGTPDERAQKYAKYSPTSYTDLSIPVISVVHTSDVIVNPASTDIYHSLVGDTWHFVAEIHINTPGPYPTIPGLPPFSSWYGHFDPLTFVSRLVYFPLLVMWSNGIIGPGAIPPVFP